MKILVAGSAGQLGHAIQEVFQKHTLLPLDHSKLDITDLASVRSAIGAGKPDIVINAAAYNDVEKAEQEAEKADAVNRQGPENLAVAANEVGIPFVHVSTDYVFDGKKVVPYHELDEVNPLSVYARSKWAGEEAVRKNNRRHYIVRTAWLFHAKGESFFRKMMKLAEKGPLRVVNDQYSSPTFAPHLAEGLLQLIDSEAYGTYHLAGQGAASRFDEFQLYLKLIGKNLSIRPVSSRDFKQAAARPAYSALTTVQVPRILLPPWEQGVQDFVSYMRREGLNV